MSLKAPKPSIYLARAEWKYTASPARLDAAFDNWGDKMGAYNHLVGNYGNGARPQAVMYGEDGTALKTTKITKSTSNTIHSLSVEGEKNIKIVANWARKYNRELDEKLTDVLPGRYYNGASLAETPPDPAAFTALFENAENTAPAPERISTTLSEPSPSALAPSIPEEKPPLKPLQLLLIKDAGRNPRVKTPAKRGR